jgi:hypothetical protein
MLLADVQTESTALIVAITGLISAVSGLLWAIVAMRRTNERLEQLAGGTLQIARNQNASDAVRSVEPEVMDTIQKLANGHGKEKKE